LFCTFVFLYFGGTAFKMESLNEDSPRCPHPAGSRVRLMPHQLAMLLRCIAIENSKSRPPDTVQVLKPKQQMPSIIMPPKDLFPLGGMDNKINVINGNSKKSHIPPTEGLAFMMDKPGTGKTFVAVALSVHESQRQHHGRRLTLVASPCHILFQWTEAVALVTGQEPVPFGTEENNNNINNNNNTKNTTKEKETTTRRRLPRWCVVEHYSDILRLYAHPREALEYDVILVSDLYFVSLHGILTEHGIPVHRLVVDEADSPAMAPVLERPKTAAHVWLVSATVGRLFGTNNNSNNNNNNNNNPNEKDENTNDELRAGPYYMPLSELPKVACVCADEFVRDSVKLEDPVEKQVKCKDAYVSFVLETPSGLEKLKDVNALAIAPPEGFVPSTLDTNTEKNDNENKNYNNNNKNETKRGLDDMTTALHYYLGYTSCNTSIYDDNDDTAPKNNNNNDITTNKDDHVPNDPEALKLESWRWQKLTALSRILRDAFAARGDSARVLIVSELSEGLEAVRDHLLYHHHDFGHCDGDIENNKKEEKRELVPVMVTGGTHETIRRAILAYHRGDANVMLLDLSKYAAGINLQVTTDLVFLHAPSRPDVRLQAVGRAQRPGRTSRLNIWYLLHDGAESLDHDQRA
jgi:hypothetical protein